MAGRCEQREHAFRSPLGNSGIRDRPFISCVMRSEQTSKNAAHAHYHRSRPLTPIILYSATVRSLAPRQSILPDHAASKQASKQADFCLDGGGPKALDEAFMEAKARQSTTKLRADMNFTNT